STHARLNPVVDGRPADSLPPRPEKDKVAVNGTVVLFVFLTYMAHLVEQRIFPRRFWKCRLLPAFLPYFQLLSEWAMAAPYLTDPTTTLRGASGAAGGEDSRVERHKALILRDSLIGKKVKIDGTVFFLIARVVRSNRTGASHAIHRIPVFQ